MNPADASDGSKRKKVKVLLRKQIPAPLLSHLSLSNDDDDDVNDVSNDERTTSTTTAKTTAPALYRDIKYDPKIPAPLLVGGLALQVIYSEIKHSNWILLVT